jgi:hypothetical protein
MSSSSLPDFPLPAIPPALIVLYDLPCRNCAYNLRTLPTSGVCPECATPVAVSLKSDLFRFSNPGWIKQLRLGAGLVVIGVFSELISIWSGNSILNSFGIILFTVGGILNLVGTNLLVLPDPSGIGEEKLSGWRNAVKILTVAIAIQLPVSAFAFEFTVSPSVRMTIRLVNLLGQLTALGLFAVVGGYLHILADRIPNLFFAASCRVLIYLMMGVGVIFGMVGLYRLLPGIPGYFIYRSWRGLFYSLANLAYLLGGLRYMRLIAQWRRMLKEEGDLARVHWANLPNRSNEK